MWPYSNVMVSGQYQVLGCTQSLGIASDQVLLSEATVFAAG